MRVKITDPSFKEPDRESDLQDCVAPGEYDLALAELKRMGRAWVGGGAAPMFLLQPVCP